MCLGLDLTTDERGEIHNIYFYSVAFLLIHLWNKEHFVKGLSVDLHSSRGTEAVRRDVVEKMHRKRRPDDVRTIRND